MSEDLNRQLLEAKERMYHYQKAQRKSEELNKRLHSQERLIIQYEVQLESEQADVERLTGLTMTNLFHTILRSKDEQLDMERQQALQAALKLQEEKQRLADTQDELKRIGVTLAAFSSAEYDYQALMKAKEAALRSGSFGSEELRKMEEQIAEQTLLVKEIKEAVTAGKRVMASLEDASDSLDKAENWGNWDLWGGGGAISTHIKHNHVDDAKGFIHQANHQLHDFRDELNDLNRSINIVIDISGTLKMADYWFDGLIADWIVQGRIQDSQQQTLDAIHNVRQVLKQLEAEYSKAEAARSGLATKRQSWIEDTKSE
ncbi:hypothetical protein [Paenibacillus sp. CF384]|uniref:hypothetical protein n=1 Tax=Paenibacillus sp. CF384 TaxID=1884382 RepID=UPI000899F24A|nr:hypothetical protein [Paenibacillus sp. CF384]SDW17621.1 hypothetical protein SAMN05518855_1001528 [Paenibacillus sp. CF384]